MASPTVQRKIPLLSRTGYQRCLDAFGSAVELNGRCEIAHGVIAQWGEILAGCICIRPKVLEEGAKKKACKTNLAILDEKAQRNELKLPGFGVECIVLLWLAQLGPCRYSLCVVGSVERHLFSHFAP